MFLALLLLGRRCRSLLNRSRTRLLLRLLLLAVGLARNLPQDLPPFLFEFVATCRKLLLLLLCPAALIQDRKMRDSLLDEELRIVLGAGVTLVAKILNAGKKKNSQLARTNTLQEQPSKPDR